MKCSGVKQTATDTAIDQKSVTPKLNNDANRKDKLVGNIYTINANNKQIINNEKKRFDSIMNNVHPSKTSTVTQIRNRSSRHHNVTRTLIYTKKADNKTINSATNSDMVKTKDNYANRVGQLSSQQPESKQSAIAQKKALDVMSKLGF